MRRVLRDYFLVIAGGNAVWEALQLPLYRIWDEGPARQVFYAAAHCTAGDILIAAIALGAAILVAGAKVWPREGYLRVAALAVAIGLAYTVASEWFNIGIRLSWAYADSMPRMPPLGTGLAPLAQWIAVPVLGFIVARPKPAA